MVVRKQAIIDRFEGKQAVLLLENGQEIQILKEELGPLVKEGAVYTIQILPDEEAALEKEELARALLNQLLYDDVLDRRGKKQPEDK